MSLIPTRFRRVFGQEPLEPELELTREMEAAEDERLTFAPFGGMVRQPDHATSMAAAAVVTTKRATLKALVLLYARDAGRGGFTDSDLVESEPSRPESSLRKRRTELTEKNWIVPSGYNRKNSHGQLSTVWLHRDFAINPPLLVSAPKKRKLSAEQERAKIAAYLRRLGNRSAFGERLADEIERGEHL